MARRSARAPIQGAGSRNPNRDRLVEQGPTRDQNAKWDSDEHGERDGSSHQPEMLRGELQDFGSILCDELQDIHEGPRLDPVFKWVSKAST
jgi:hypothetical protein